MSANLITALMLMLAIGFSTAGVVNAQSNSTIIGNGTDLVDNATGILHDGNAITDNATESATNSTFSNETANPDIVINEVELNPRANDVGREWIELYNPTEVDTNISNFEIRTSFKSASIALPSDAVIEGNKIYVMELDRQVLSNTAESLDLADDSGKIIDSTPSLVDRSDNGSTWQRIPDGNNEWKFAANTRDELNDPGGQAITNRSGHSNSAVCQGTAGCAEGVATRIVDGDTLYVKINATTYKIDLALASVPSRTEEGHSESSSFTRDLCLGNSVLVDQDDNLLTTETSVIAVVYCASINLNSELLYSGHALLDMTQCKTSEFAAQHWATDHGC